MDAEWFHRTAEHLSCRPQGFIAIPPSFPCDSGSFRTPITNPNPAIPCMGDSLPPPYLRLQDLRSWAHPIRNAYPSRPDACYSITATDLTCAHTALPGSLSLGIEGVVISSVVMSGLQCIEFFKTSDACPECILEKSNIIANSIVAMYSIGRFDEHRVRATDLPAGAATGRDGREQLPARQSATGSTGCFQPIRYASCSHQPSPFLASTIRRA
jgi:hypothetical protein